MSIATQMVRRLFDLPARSPRDRRQGGVENVSRYFPQAGCITLITGASGGGKSSLLRRLRKQSLHCIDPASIRLPDKPVIDVVCALYKRKSSDGAIQSALQLLSRVGLAEAWTYLRRPKQLSDGQRWRLIIALAVAKAQSKNATHVTIIAMDEFAALLDRVTAVVVARALRRVVSQSTKLGAIVVTSHEDIAGALRPDTHVICDFGAIRVVKSAAAAEDAEICEQEERQQYAGNNQQFLK